MKKSWQASLPLHMSASFSPGLVHGTELQGGTLELVGVEDS